MVIEQVISEFKDALYRFVIKHVHNKEDAKDLHQEILVKIFSKYQTLKDDNKLESWIFQIARNTITDYYRHTKKRQTLDHSGITERELEHNGEKELILCIKPFLKRLKPSYQDALEFTAFGNRTQKELAEEMNMSYSGAKSTVQRARKKLKEFFSDCCQIETDNYGGILSVTKKNSCSCS